MMREITTTYLISQGFTLLMYIFLGRSYLVKTKWEITICHECAQLANIMAFLLLGAWSGLAMCCIAFVRNAYMLIDEQRHGTRLKIERRDVYFLLVVYLAVIIAAIGTYNGPASLLAVIAFALQTYSIWQKQPIVYKLLGIPVTAFYLGYNLYIWSLFGIILEAVMLLVSAVGFGMALRERKVADGKNSS